MKRKHVFISSIRSELLITFMVVAIVPIAFLVFISHRIVSNITETRIGSSMEQMMKQFGVNINTIMDSTENLATLLLLDDEPNIRSNIIRNSLSEYRNYDHFERMNNRKTIESTFFRFSILNLFVESIYLTTEYEFIAGAPITIAKDVEPSMITWYSDFIKSDKQAMWSGLHSTQLYGTATNSNVVSYMKKVHNSFNTKVMGVIWIDINERKFYNFYKELGLINSARVFILGPEKDLISHSHLAEERTIVNPENYLRVFSEKNGHYLDKINGETVLVAHAFLEQVGWNIIYTVRMSELMAPYYRVINFYLVLSIILLTFLTLLIIRRSYGLSTPIIDLMNLMKKAAGGDFSIRAQVNKNNEIGQLCGIFNSMVHDIDVLIKQVYEAQTKQREAQLTSLQLQINPHFLYNTLQTIKWLADSYDARDIQQIVMSLADMFRYSISSEKYALLDEELNNIRDYIQIQHFRYGNRLSVDYDIEPGTEKIKIPKLFLQPLVENAILHGIDGKLGGGHIRVQVYRTDPWLHISVWDDGIGIEEEHLFFIRQYLAWNEKVKESKVPIGLKNLYDRGKLEFGENFSFSIESTFNEYTVVDLTIIPKT